MKFRILALFILVQTSSFAQKPCEFITNVTDSIGTYKETQSCLVYEKVFGNSAQLIFLSLASENEIPMLKLQVIQKSKDFITPKCIDTASKLFFQLSNGKVITLVYADEGKCDNLIYNEAEKENNRFLEASFFFLKNDFEDLKKYSISLMKINYSSGAIDYVLPKAIVSEKIGTTSSPENFFKDNYNCLFSGSSK